jgi:uncharacterized protein with von Willebrand factor type A (vWA) domain
MTIQQTVTIPADRRLHLDLSLPPDIPKGPAELKMIFRAKAPRELRIPIVSWFERRREAAQRKAIMDFAGCLKDSPVFEGDPVEIFRKERDEWDERLEINEKT